MTRRDIIVFAPNISSFDAMTAKPLLEEYRQNLIDANFPHCVLDLSGVQFIDSSGFGAMISLLKLLRKQESEMVLCCLSAPIQEVFHLMSMGKVLALYATLEEAKSHFSSLVEKES